MRNNRKVRIRHSCIILIGLLLCLAGGRMFIGTGGQKVSAYTEQQKQQAKSWLTAHGYAPTREGAYQAYSDYKKGKLKLSEGEKKLAKNQLSQSSVSQNKGKKKSKKATSKKKQKISDIQNQTKQRKKEKTTIQETDSIQSKVTVSPVKTVSPQKRNDNLADTKKSEQGGNLKPAGMVGALLLVIVLVIGIGVLIRKRKTR